MEWYDVVPITQVYNRLWVGGYIQAKKLVIANPHNIRAVLNVSTEPPYEQARGIAYLHIPFEDGHAVPEAALHQCMTFLSAHYIKGDDILTHCTAGISRSVGITAAFMHDAHIMEFADALDYINKRRPIANPHREILISIRKAMKIWPYDGSLGITP